MMIPLLGTSAGGACVFFMKRGLDINIQAEYAIEADVTSSKGYTDSSVNAVTEAINALTAALNANDYIAIEEACEDLNFAVSSAKLKTDSEIKATARKTLSANKSKTTKFAISKALKISGKSGTLTYKKANKSGGSKITVNAKTGKITVKKGLKKGKTYSVKIRVNDSGNGDVKAGAATATVKIKVKKQTGSNALSSEMMRG